MNLTLIVIWSAIASLVIYDIFIITKEGKFESVSAYIIRSSRKFPLIVLVLGITLGHLFWSMDTFDWQEKEVLMEKCKILLDKNTKE